VTLAIVIVFGCVLMFGGLLAVEGIESSRADRAMAKASAEQAKAGAVAAQAQARVDEAEVEANKELQAQLDRQAHEIALMREAQVEFEKNFALAALAISNMGDEDVSTLERWLGLGGNSALDIVLAAALAVGAFLLLVGLFPLLRSYVNRKAEAMWET
jgi:hypothetical protein